MNKQTKPLAEINAWQVRFESVLEQQLPGQTVEPVLLHEAMRYSAQAGGKRFRPLLIYASGRALGVGPKDLDAIACAIELIHAYSLVHDDLPAMDDDDLRRGRPSCHRAFDEATAILAGDALQALAFEILARQLPASSENSLQLINLIANACGSTGMAGGQALDLSAVGNELNLQQLETMHQLKTGVLIHAAVIAPCLLIGADADLRNKFSTYGKNVGLAFQVHDDILDVTGDSDITGKSSRADAALNKPTFPSIIGLEESQRRAIALRDEAIEVLDGLPGDTTMMAWLAGYVVSRDR